MSRPKSSLGDIANFGANVYQSRQMSKLASQQAEHNALLQMQMENMQMQQRMEEMKKEALKHARTLILEFEDVITETRGKIQKNPVIASIEADALAMAFSDAQSSGMNSDFFEEMYDLERFRKVESGIKELKDHTSNLSDEQFAIKENILAYSMQFDDYEKAIILAGQVPNVRARHEELSSEVSQLSSKWENFEENAIVLNKATSKKENILFALVSVICLLIMGIATSNSELLGISADSDDGYAAVLGGACLAWIFLGGGVFTFFEGRKVVIPDSETLLGESSVSEIESELSLYRSMDSELFSDEIIELEYKLIQMNGSNNTDLEFKVPHSGDPFEEYYVILESTLGKCKIKLESLENEFQILTSSLGKSEVSELQSSLQTKRDYVDYYSKESIGIDPKIDQASSVEAKINWVLHEGYYYKQFGDGSFDSTPHIRNNEGLIIPYQTPKPPSEPSNDFSNQLGDLDF